MKLELRTPPSDLCVISKRGFVAQDRAFADNRVSAYVATAADDGIAYLGKRGNARVRPDNRVLDNGLFLDMHPGADHGIYDPRAGLDRAAVSDNGFFVDLG